MDPEPQLPHVDVNAVCAVCGIAHLYQLTRDQWDAYSRGEPLGTCHVCKLPLTPEFVRYAKAAYIDQAEESD